LTFDGSALLSHDPGTDFVVCPLKEEKKRDEWKRRGGGKCSIRDKVS